MTQVIAYKVYTTGTSLAYCGVAGSVADGYVASGTVICSDPFLQDQIAIADGTDWRYVGGSHSWSQPIMTGNQMTIGGSSWGIYESGGQTGNLWKISDRNSGTYWDAGRPGLPINVIFYNPDPILATSVYFYNYSSDGINNYSFSGSNDNSTWTELSSGSGKGHNAQWTDTITTSTPYKYFRLQVTKTLDGSGWLNLREVTISGTEYSIADPVISDLGSDAVKRFMMAKYTAPSFQIPWTAGNFGTGESYNAVAYGDGKFIAVGDSGDVAVSTDGFTWTSSTIANRNLSAIAYGNNMFVCCGEGYAYTSSDGTTWSSEIYLGTSNVTGICYSGDKWVCVTDTQTTYYSSDASTWTTGSVGTSDTLHGVSYGNGYYIATGGGAGGTIYTSTTGTGTRWARYVPSSYQGTNNMMSSAYGNGVWVCVAETSHVYTSSNATNWTGRPITGHSENLYFIVFQDGFFYAVGGSGVLLCSTDGTSWTYLNSGTSNTLKCIAFSDSIGVAVGGNYFTYVEKSASKIDYFFPALCSSGAITNYYSPAIAPDHPYAHYEGTIYPIDDAPAGAYPLTDLQYYTINYYVNAGGTLRWYSNQRPYVDEYVAWTQPVLTTNTTTVTDLGNVTATASSYGNNSGGSASGNEYPYHAMDGVKSGSGTTYWGCNASNPAGQWWQVVFPYQIKITGLTHYNRYGNSYANVTGQFWTSSDRTTPIGDAFGATGATGWKATAIQNIPASGVVTDTIYFYITAGANYCGIGELEITATRYAILYEVPLTNFVS